MAISRFGSLSLRINGFHKSQDLMQSNRQYCLFFLLFHPYSAKHLHITHKASCPSMCSANGGQRSLKPLSFKHHWATGPITAVLLSCYSLCASWCFPILISAQFLEKESPPKHRKLGFSLNAQVSRDCKFSEQLDFESYLDVSVFDGFQRLKGGGGTETFQPLGNVKDVQTSGAEEDWPERAKRMNGWMSEYKD